MERCLIVTTTESKAEDIKNLLSSHKFEVTDVEYTVSGARKRALLTDYDIAIIDAPLKDEFGDSFAIDLAGKTYGQVVFFAPQEFYDEISYKLGEYGVFTVEKPIDKDVFASVLKVANASFNKFLRIRKENENVAKKVEEIKLINRAKYILIETLKFSEETAHRYIEKEAMNRRVTKRQVALDIISKNRETF